MKFHPESETLASHPPRPLLVVLQGIFVSIASAAMGVAPLAAAVEYPWLIGAASAIALIESAIALRTMRTRSTARVTGLTISAAILDSVQSFAGIGLIALTIYGTIFWISRAATAIFAADWSSSSVASVAVVIILLLFVALVTPIQSRDVADKMYPDTVGLPTRYRTLRTARTIDILAIVISFAIFVAVTAVLLVAETKPDWWLALSAYVALSIASTKADPGTTDAVRPTPAPPLLSALSACGYVVMLRPRTGSAEIDPLIEEVDILARRGPDALAITLAPREQPSDGSRRSVASIVTAARALRGASVIGAESERLGGVTPVLISLESITDKSAIDYALDAGAVLMTIDVETDAVDLPTGSMGSDVRDVGVRFLGAMRKRHE